IHYTTVYKVFARWADDGSLWQGFVASVRHLAAEKQLDLRVLHGDGTNTVAKKGGVASGCRGTNRSGTPSRRLIRQHEIRVEYPSFTTCGRGFYHGLRSLFLPAGADRPGVAVRHAPDGVAQRPRCRGPAAGAPTPSAKAQASSQPLGGPHHQA